ncbi:MAG TPA: TIGR01244 family sulfur transferase [Croceibacterium sp.]|nr:TIGR01244 family sulfur transferase [Croceibacterium sp.]
MEYTHVSDDLAVGPQVTLQDLPALAAAGFAGIINNRPDHEGPDQPTSLELERAARNQGLAYWYIPVVPGEMSEDDVRAFASAVSTADGPVLAFCRTGNRAAALWKAVQERD